LEGGKNHNSAETQNLVRAASCPLPGNYAKLILRTIKYRERNVLNASQFGFRAHHSMALQCVRLADHIIRNFNNDMSTAAVFLDTEKAFDKTWHSALLNKLSELAFSMSLIKIIASLLTENFKC
jgi:hypothetical protein